MKDILSTLTAWEAELIRLLWQVRQGEKPTTAHFGSISVDEFNALIYQDTHNRPFERVFADFEAVRKQTTRRVETFSDKELVDSNRFSWSEKRPLWKWIASDSFQHESEHAIQIQAWKIHQENQTPPQETR